MWYDKLGKTAQELFSTAMENKWENKPIQAKYIRINNLMMIVFALAIEAKAEFLEETDKYIYYSYMVEWALKNGILNGHEYWSVRSFLAEEFLA